MMVGQPKHVTYSINTNYWKTKVVIDRYDIISDTHNRMPNIRIKTGQIDRCTDMLGQVWVVGIGFLLTGTAWASRATLSQSCDKPWVCVGLWVGRNEYQQLACLFSNWKDLVEIREQTPWVCFTSQDHGVINACGLMLVVSLQGVQHRTTKCY
jgi:hypothetical protein